MTRVSPAYFIFSDGFWPGVQARGWLLPTLSFVFSSIFSKRENPETIGEKLNRQLRVPRQNALGFHR
jgi:hypothetical protein